MAQGVSSPACPSRKRAKGTCTVYSTQMKRSKGRRSKSLIAISFTARLGRRSKLLQAILAEAGWQGPFLSPGQCFHRICDCQHGLIAPSMLQGLLSWRNLQVRAAAVLELDSRDSWSI